MRRPKSPDVLREPNFRRYLAAEAVSDLGSGMAVVALAFAVLGFGGPTDLGIVLLAREIPIESPASASLSRATSPRAPSRP